MRPSSPTAVLSKCLARVAWLGLSLGVASSASAQPDGRSLTHRVSDGPQVDLDSIVPRNGRFVADLEDGGLAELTLDPATQRTAEGVLEEFAVPFGAAVAISIPDGRVLALAGRSAVEPTLGLAELALAPWAPAASVFKIVSATALVEQARLTGATRICYHGGVSAVMRDNLVDIPKLDRSCASLGYAVGKSQNAIIAKLAARHLTPAGLARAASAFGFGQRIPFAAAIEPSEAEIPVEQLELARAAAGFWHSSLSAMHGALIAASIANRGEMPAPRLIEKAVDAAGRPVKLPGLHARRVVDAAVAQEVGRMMVLTTTMGTARRGFHDHRGMRYLPVEVAGKTGSLSYRGQPGDPPLPAALPPPGGYLGYSWFVGYAPADRPRIAFAVVVGNPAAWRIKATFVARRMVAEYLASTGDTAAASPAVATR